MESQPRSDFNTRLEQSTSDPVVDPDEKSRPVKEVSKEVFDRLHQRVVYSGPLTSGAGWSNAERKLKDFPSFSREPRLSTLSSLGQNRSSVAQESGGKSHIHQNKRTNDAAERYPRPVSDSKGGRDQDCLYYSGTWMEECQQLQEKTSVRKSLVSFKAFSLQSFG